MYRIAFRSLSLESSGSGEKILSCRKDNKSKQRNDNTNDRVEHSILCFADLILITGRGEIEDTRHDETNDGEESKDSEKPVHECQRQSRNACILES
jgi:hypothetical protein